MAWRTREGGTKGAERLQQERDSLTLRISEAMARQAWGAAYDDLIQLHKMYRDGSALRPVTQSELAMLHGRLGLVMQGQRRFEEAHRDLAAAERLFNMEPEAAVEWAAEQGITVEGIGDEIDYALALEVLQALADSALRQGESGVGGLLSQVVAVADSVGHPTRRWEARTQLAAFTAGLADWEALIEIAHEMGRFAYEQRNFAQLLPALRHMAEAYLGLRRPGQALQVQELVVDIARFLSHGTLAAEQAELDRIRKSVVM